MNKKFFLILTLFAGLFISTTSVDAAPLLSSHYMIPTDSNNEVGKEIPLNLVNLKYIGKDIRNDVFLNDKLGIIIGRVNKNDIVIIKNMGMYKEDTIDVNIKFLAPANMTVLDNGTVYINPVSANIKGIISMNVYKHDTKTIYPDLYVGYPDQINNGLNGYQTGDSFEYQSLYGIYLPKDLGTILESTDLTQHDGFLDLRYGKGDDKNPKIVYPIFENTETGFIRGKFFSGRTSITLFDPRYPSPIPIPYDGAIALNNEKTTTDITYLDVDYTVTQKLSNYVSPSQYPSDQTFKIKTDFEVDFSEASQLEMVVKLANNQVVDKKYYSSVSLNNSNEVNFSTDFLKDYKGETIKIEYKQRLVGQNVNLMDYYNIEKKAFIFPYSSENKWERQGGHFKQKEPSIGETKIKFSIKLDTTILNGKNVIQNKSTDDYQPLDFISDLTTNIPGDSADAVFTKKVIFENKGEQNIYITLKSSLSSATKDIVVNVVVIEGMLHFTEVPSELNFPTIALTDKVTDYEVSSFNEGHLSVSDDRVTKSPWSLTVRLTENKTSNNFGDILYFRNEEGAIYNITDQTQNVMTNRDLEPTKTVIDYEENKKIGLFIRINPLFVKKGMYEGGVIWSLVDAPD